MDIEQVTRHLCAPGREMYVRVLNSVGPERTAEKYKEYLAHLEWCDQCRSVIDWR